MQPSTYQPFGNNNRKTGALVGLLPASERKSRPWWPSQAMSMAVTTSVSPRSSYSPLKFGNSNDNAGSLSDGGGGEEQDELNQMLQNLGCPSSEPSCEVEEALDLAKANTSESTQLSNLLSTLNGKTAACSHPFSTGTMAGLGTAALPAVGRDWAGGGREGTVVSHVQLEDSESDDTPLISKRAMCTQDTFPRNVSKQGAVLGMPTPPLAPVVGDDAPAASHLSDGLQQQAGSFANLKYFGGVGGSVFGSEAAGCVLYVAVFLTQESRDVLLSMVPAVHPIVSANHMTLAYKPSLQQLLMYPLGAEVQLQIIGTAADSRAQAVVADPPVWLPPTTAVSTHVTVSVAVGAKPVEAGHLIMDALQRTAVADPAAPELSGPGAFRHFDDPLALVGRLGVKLVPPAAAAVAAQNEILAFSIEDVARTGYVSISAEQLEMYHRQHASILGKQPYHLQLSPSISNQLGMLPRTSRTSTDSYSPLTAGAMPPLKLCPSVLPPSPRPSEALGDGTACQTPVPYSSIALASGSARSSDAAGAAAGNQLQQPLQQHSPLATAAAADDAAEELMNNSAAEDAASTSSGSSGSDAVQFKSAVQIGDYVALRPYVTTDNGEKLVQGFVKEYACDEPFQGMGVLVVLNDNTIGFVTAVLDTCMEPGGSSGSGRQRPAPAASSSRAAKRSKGNKAAACSGSGADFFAPGSLVATDNDTAGGADVLSEWALSARETPAAAAVGRRNAEDAQRDLQLWKEFDGLQQQHGEALCNAILEDCEQDFVEAIAVIKAQACTGGSSTNTGSSSPALAGPSSQSTPTPAAATVAAAAEGSDEEDLVTQLALSLGLSSASAVQLCRLAPHMSAESIVELLQQHGGDVNKAADALLSASQLPGSNGSRGGGGGSAARSSSDNSTPASRAMSALMSGRDPEMVLKARSLCAMFGELQMDTAELLLQEHDGNLDQAAEAVSDMQAKELEARTAAAAGSSSPLARQLQLQQSITEHPQQGFMSEADQLAVLAAMGELSLEDDDAPTAHKQARRSSANNSRRQPANSPPKSPVLMGQAGPSSYSPVAHGQGRYGSPRRTGGFAHHQHNQQQQQQSLLGFADQEAKKVAKEAADKLYAKSKTLNDASSVYMTAAQALLADGNVEGYREKKAAADKARADSRAAFDEAQRLSWSANNKVQQTWKVDLHGLGTSVALRKFVLLLDMLSNMDSPGGVVYHVITGKGNHSEDNVPKIKMGVLQYLQEKAAQTLQETGQPWAVTWEVDPTNEGLLNVFIPGTGAVTSGPDAQAD